MEYTEINHKQEIERLEHEFFDKERGYTTYIEVFPAGGDGNIEWNASVVEVIKITDTIVAYRYKDDSVDTRWNTGATWDAVDMAIEIQKQEEY